jgi:hypothetical protein
MADDTRYDFTTPDQVKALRAMAEALSHQSLTPMAPIKPGEVFSPFQGLAQMTQALVGNMNLNRVGQQEKESMIGAGEQMRQDLTPPGAPSGYGDAYSRATSAQESGGNYHAIGPTILHGSMAGDKAYGKYQIMGTNIPKWTQEVLGRPMSPAEFLNSPEAQEAVYKTKFGEYVQKYGPEGAARAWLGGPGGVNHPERKDQLGTSIGQYGKNFMRLASNSPDLPSGGSPISVPGAAAVSPLPGQPPPAVAQMAEQLAQGGQPQVAARGGAIQPPGPGQPSLVAPSVMPPGGTTAEGANVPSGVFPQRQTVTPGGFSRLMANPWVPANMRDYTAQSYLGQFQPAQFKTPYGTLVRSADGQQTFIGDVVEMTYDGPEGIKIPIKFRYDQNGRMIPLPGQEEAFGKITPGSQPSGPVKTEENTAPVAPTKTGGPAPPAAPAPASVPGKSGSAEPAEPAAKPVQLASLETGTVSDAAPPGAGMLAQKPPAEATTPPPGTQVAQEGPIGGLMGRMMQMGLDYNRSKETNKKDVENQQKRFYEITSAAEKSVVLGQDFRIAQQITSDPDFVREIGGPLASIKLPLATLKAAFGNEVAQRAVALDQSLEKITASGILDTMRETLQGLGQVRVAEIDLLKKAAASRYNTFAANQAILDIAQRSQQLQSSLGRLVSNYNLGYKLDKDGNPVLGKDGTPMRATEAPTGIGQENAIRKYYVDHPLFNDQEIKDYMNRFEMDKQAPKGAAAAAPTGPSEAEQIREQRRKQAPPATAPASQPEIQL